MLVIVVLVASYYIWGWANAAAFRRDVAALASRGEPTTVADLRPAAVPAEQNGYVQIREALGLAPKSDSRDDPFAHAGGEPKLPLFDDERAALQKAVDPLRPALAALRPAADKPAVVADHVRFESPALSILLPDLSGLRNLARAAQRAALIDFDGGRHDAALEDLRAIEPLARGAGSHVSLVGMLVATGCRGLEADTIMQMAPTLRVGASPGDASPQQVRQAIARLLDDSAARRDLIMGMKSERVFQVDTMQCLADGRLEYDALAMASGKASQGGSWLLRVAARPLLWSNARFCLEQTGRIIDAVDAPDWPSADARLTPLQREIESAVVSPRLVFARLLMPSLSRAVMTHHRGVADRRMAATALAVRLYQADHGGRAPATLADLVPAYLPAVPPDPMSRGRPLNYRADGDTPAVWSVGEDGKDDGGSREPTEGRKPSLPTDRWQARDAVVPLKVLPREKSVIVGD